MSTFDLFSLKEKKGFITGVARGIGKCLADAFTEMGASIAIVDIDIAEAEKTAKELATRYSTHTIAIRCDVTDAEDVGHARRMDIENPSRPPRCAGRPYRSLFYTC